MNIWDLLIVVLFNTLFSCAADWIKESTSIPKSILRLSSLRKRSLLLPDHGSIKLTIGIGKALIGNSPKGLSLSWEISNYYSGPSAIKDWLSEVPHQPMRKSSELFNKTNSEKFVHENYFQPKTKKYQDLLNTYYDAPLDYVSYSNSISPMVFEGKEPAPYKGFRRNHMNSYRDLLRGISKRSNGSGVNLLSRWMDDGQSKSRSSLEEILTLLLGADVKCSILRSICRSKQFLLPPGYSMIQDIVRTMFLNSTAGRASGEETINLCDTTSHCDLEHETSHSFNFLDWILNPVKVV